MSGRLRDAELAISPKKTDQLMALESHWKRLKKIEELNKALFDAARITVYDYEESRYHRLTAEIHLEHAKAGKLPFLESWP
jgi:hypothetical protein